MARIVTIGLVQMSMGKDPVANLEKALRMTAETAKRGAQIVVLPELFTGHYFCQSKSDKEAFAHAEPVPGPTTRALAETAKKHSVVLVGGSIFEKNQDARLPDGQGKHYNTCPVFDVDGTLVGLYRKTHIPQDPGFYEQNYFAAADNPITVMETSRGKIAPLVCFDQWSPEAARVAALNGAEIIVYPTAIGNVEGIAHPEGSWQEGWETVQRGHSAANQVYVAAVNRVGREDKTTFWGGSFIAGPFGQVQAHGGTGEEIVIAECDLDLVRETQDAWGILRNRRPDLYSDLIKKGPHLHQETKK